MSACIICNVTGGKKAPAAAGKGKAAGDDTKKAAAAAPKERVWGPQDDAALKIQTSYRRHLAKKDLEKKRKEKEEYDALMEKLERDVSYPDYETGVVRCVYLNVIGK